MVALSCRVTARAHVGMPEGDPCWTSSPSIRPLRSACVPASCVSGAPVRTVPSCSRWLSGARPPPSGCRGSQKPSLSVS
eukprot:15454385-Alexandrium_andersonii.AAC.1